ncbi:MAG: hypothetical protein U1E42_05710 [Rhodospirillales bacterium]
MKSAWLALTLTAVLATQPGSLFAEPIRQERVHFKAGASSATIEGRIKGDEVVDYVLGAREGQSMNISMATDNTANYFNILAPGQNEEAMFIGSTSGNQFEGVLPATGDYKVRVYLMRNAARRKEAAKYRLEMIVNDSGKGAAADQAAVTTAVASASAGQGNSHATGQIPCAEQTGQPMGQCKFAVSREGDGTATVVVTKHDGRTRALVFTNGKFSGADVSQAEGTLKSSATREGDLSLIRVGTERYEIPDAVVYGG